MIPCKFVSLVCSLALFFCLAGCASSNSNGPISIVVSPQSAYVGSGQSLQLSATVANSNSGVTWSVGGSSSGTIDGNGNFMAPTVTQNTTVTITAASVKDPSITASATVVVIAPGTVAATANPQVALYTISVPDGLSVSIQFGADTTYGLTTWAVPAPAGGGPVPIFVAGMKGDTAYHLRALFEPTGTTTTTVFTDNDHTFTTTAYPSAKLPALTATTTQGQIPQQGVELLALLSTTGGSKFNTVVTDLNGSVIWAYDPGSSIALGTIPNPIKLLPNGHFLIIYSGAGTDGQNSTVQEVDLTGTVVWQMTSAQLNAALVAATCAGCNITVIGFHHDFAILPNGHFVFLASTQQTVSGTLLTGDVLIDMDSNHNPVWLWNSFDHLDVNRRSPGSNTDWTHSNAIVYSPDDKNLMLSIRHQSWVIKINYNDGAGDGSILWKLGYQGDFVLQSGTTNAVDPIDWFSYQHDANFVSTTTAGTLDVLLMDNANQRVLQSSPLILCGPSTTPCDSRVPVFHLDETAKTADITWVDKLAPVFSFFGGSARLLKNGNVEFDECASTPLPANNASVFEVTRTTPPVTVWQMQISGQFAYRAIRVPSLYPGVQW
jgi:arylsulfate sulfotransferase